jgi:hypothetical protein
MRKSQTIAMQKVVGSSPISRFEEALQIGHFARPIAREHRRSSDTERTLGANKSAARCRRSPATRLLSGVSRSPERKTF